MGDSLACRRLYGDARLFYGEALAAWRAFGTSPNGIVFALVDLGIVASKEGDHCSATELMVDGLKEGAEFYDKTGVAGLVPGPLEGLAILLFAQGDVERGLLFASAAASIRESADKAIKLKPNWQEHLDVELASARRDLGPSAADGAWDKGRGLIVREASRIAQKGSDGT